MKYAKMYVIGARRQHKNIDVSGLCSNTHVGIGQRSKSHFMASRRQYNTPPNGVLYL